MALFLCAQGERQPVLDLLRKRHEAEERDLKLKLKLDSDVHMERLRKVGRNLLYHM